jgi:uncharacterized protein YbjT (DUF2867 family)
MKIVIFGATGTAGSEVVRQAISDPDITKVIVVVRRPLGFEHPKMQIIIRHDFLDYKELLLVFREMDACIWCLGISQTKVNKEQYFIITHDYAVCAARAMLSVNPEISFVFLSGQGADSSEKSRILFARVKGQTENALKLLPFKHLYILRPAGIVPVFQNGNLLVPKKSKFSILKLMAMVLPQMTISTVVLAQAMLILIKSGEPFMLLENKNIKAII